MVFKNQAFHSPAGLTLEEQGGSKSANSATNDYAVIELAGIDDVLGEQIVHAVTNRVTCFENIQSVAIRSAVVADAAVTGEVIILSQQLRGSDASEQGGSRGQQSGAKKVAPRYARLHS